MANSYKYAVISAIPDQIKAERINIGLMVFKSDTVDVRILNNLAKLRALGGETNIDYYLTLGNLFNQLHNKSFSTEQQYTFFKNVGAGVHLSDRLGEFTLQFNDDYEKHVDALMSKLVIPASRLKGKATHSRLITSIRTELKKLNVFSRESDDIMQHKVVENFPISKNDGLYADFAMKNGVYHITETVDYGIKNPKERFDQSASKALSFIKAREVFGDNTNLLFVYSADTDTESKIITQLNLTSDYASDTFNMLSSVDTKRYYNNICKAMELQ